VAGPSRRSARRERATRAVLRILLRAIHTLRHASPGAPIDARLGAVSFLHRFGSSLNSHLHFHLVVLDGVFSRGDDGHNREALFHEATLLQPDHWSRLQGVLAIGAERGAVMAGP
jgi:hypothetical protein